MSRRHLVAWALVAAAVMAGCDSTDRDASPSTLAATSTSTSTSTTTSASSTTTTPASTTSMPMMSCAGDPPFENKRVEFDTPDGTRSYLVATPAEVGDRVLLVNLHGHGGSADQIANNNGMSGPGTEAGFVVVTPDGLGSPARWNFDRQPGEVDDYDFMRRLIDDVLDRYCVESGDVVLVGNSNGAAFAGLYGCQDERVSAIAMVIATVPDTCGPGRRVPSVLTIRGDADTVVPYERAPELLATWAVGAGCSETSTSAEVWPGVERVAYLECDDGQVAAIDTIAGGVHAWPGGRQRQENSEAGATYPATERIIEFFVQSRTSGQLSKRR